MSFSVVASVDHLTQEYRRYLKSAYRLADPKLRSQFENHIKETDVLVKGPYVTLSHDFAKGKTLAELVKEGFCHPDLAKLAWSFERHPLHQHQESSLRAVEQKNRNIIVKTGTGSGKTESFLLPVISGALKLRDRGVTGTKAILLYPMNALANDQLCRLRKLFQNAADVPLTFAMYTGESETVATTLKPDPVEGKELWRREDIRNNPPDIILTNYKELEFLLIRKEDRNLFSSALNYLVLDEIHSYRGALATEISCLIRRVKARCGLQDGALHCLGTSATVSQDVGGDTALAKFASNLFGEHFESSDVIGETLAEKEISADLYLPPFPKLTVSQLEESLSAKEEKVLALAELITGKKSGNSGEMSQKIKEMMDGNKVVSFLETECLQPCSLFELTKSLQNQFAGAKALTPDEAELLIKGYLLIGSVGEVPVLRPKLHTFFHGVYDVGMCMNPDCREMVKNSSERCPKCGSMVRPLVLCRTCGQDFVKVTFPVDEPNKTIPNDDYWSDKETTGFIASKIVEEIEEEEEEGDEEDTAPKKRGRKKTPVKKLEAVYVDHNTGEVFTEKPLEERSSFTKQHLLKGEGKTCPICHATNPRGDIITPLRSGAASTTSVLATHHLDQLPEDGRKLLIFADNRQDAAHQSGYMSDHHRRFAIRYAIRRVIQDATNEGDFIQLDSIQFKLLEEYKRIKLAKKNLTKAEERKWHLALQFESAMEFCSSTHQRISLEAKALVEVQYEFLGQMTADMKFEEICKQCDLPKEEGSILVRAILDYMRRHRAVSFEFYQQYINENKDPWNELSEKYGVVIPEREKYAVFFMMDRPESARVSVGGCKFNPFVKDCSRGGGGGIARMCKKAGLNEHHVDIWLHGVVQLLQEYEILESPVTCNKKARQAIRGGTPLQISARVIRLAIPDEGYRCSLCQIWRPYRGNKCYATLKCTAESKDINASVSDKDGYYEKLYTEERPRRLLALEHTAQIDQKERARREDVFKKGNLDVLVCSPTLELGVDIGDLLTVLLRNSPPTPANYIQRAGRAGRKLKIGFVSTFCGSGSHDRHCFEHPEWLVRGEFYPPFVKLDNGKIVERHTRSFILEELNAQFPALMSEFVDNLDNPAAIRIESIQNLLDEIPKKEAELVAKCIKVFGKNIPDSQVFCKKVVTDMSREIIRILEKWFLRIRTIHQEFEQYSLITADRRSSQKAAARRRAYKELTEDRQTAYTLNYLANEGFLPSYQFPMDTFSLDPGVNDTPTLRRPAWIALFEFAPGNLVYANGHKLKSIRAAFEGRDRGASGDRKEGALDTSGRVRPYCFCSCGYSSEKVLNECPRCHQPLTKKCSVAFVESFEAEENTQISSSEETRQRLPFIKEGHLVPDGESKPLIYPYPFSHLEFQRQAKIVITNWGKKKKDVREGEGFDLCQSCGKHRPSSLSDRECKRWDEDHRQMCAGEIAKYVLGYEFKSDVLLLPIPRAVIPIGSEEKFRITLGEALSCGAEELLEIEPEEIDFFAHQTPDGDAVIAFYETMPGGAGYLQSLAESLPKWAEATRNVILNHECTEACYKCLKNYKNQQHHRLLDKRLVGDILFQFATHALLSRPFEGKNDDGLKTSNLWTAEHGSIATKDTPIEQKLLEAIRQGGRLPQPITQKEFKDDGTLITVADFAFEDQKIAIYCDGFAYHAKRDVLESDAFKRNYLQAKGWAVLVFWGRTILNQSQMCEEEIWKVYCSRKSQ